MDALETRSEEARARDLAAALPAQIARAAALPAYGWGIDPAGIATREALAALPVLRKSALMEMQANGGLGGLAPRALHEYDHLFQSPGPIYEPGMAGLDWWRGGRHLRALGIGPTDIVQNCFSYHLTPAGLIFENAARAVGAAVIPAGTGQTELQVRAGAQYGATAYAGTPDYLKVILDAAAQAGTELRISKAAVGGGALFPSLRAHYTDAGILCLQSYATADLGIVAYETHVDGAPCEGMVVDEGVVVEIVRPGTGDPVPDGEVGEVVVTTLNPDWPLVRFATGDLSAVLEGRSPCGRTNMRIKGWMGRADQTAKVKGMFVRPEQVAELCRHLGAPRARVTVTRDGEADAMRVEVEGAGIPDSALQEAVMAYLRLRADVGLVEPGSLPNDGVVIDDARDYG